MKTAYICSPYSGDTKRNKEYARQLTKHALDNGFSPITPHLYITEVLDDNNANERLQGLQVALRLAELCDTMIVGNKYGISAGMNNEIMLARLKGMDIIEC